MGKAREVRLIRDQASSETLQVRTWHYKRQHEIKPTGKDVQAANGKQVRCSQYEIKPTGKGFEGRTGCE